MEFKLIEALDELSAFYKDDLNMVKDLIFECNKHFNNEQIEMIIKHINVLMTYIVVKKEKVENHI